MTTRHEVSPRLNGKITWQPNANNKFTGHLQYDSYNITGRAGVSADARRMTNREGGCAGIRVDDPVPAPLQLEHVRRGEVHRLVGLLRPEPDEQRREALRRATAWPPARQGCFYYADRTRDQVNASVTHYAEKFGRHELKFGAEFEHSTVRNRYGYPGGAYFYDYGGVPYYAYNYSYDFSARNSRQSLFAQDAWHATNRLTVNAGVRGDMHPGGGKNGGNVYSSNNWAPRLGAAFDLAGDNRTVIKGSYGLVLRRAADAAVRTGAARDKRLRHLSGQRRRITRGGRPMSGLPPYKVADDIKHPARGRRDDRVRTRADRHDAAVADRGLARQQELRQLGRPVRAMDADQAHHRRGEHADVLQLDQP